MDRSAWEVAEVNKGRVAPMIRASHYLHRMPAIVPCALALSIGGWIRGALVWAIPPHETSKRYGGVTWELARLWLSDELPHNSETWFIARGIKHVRVAHRDVQILVSYADPAAGHEGTIYKAANWTYEGLSAKRKDVFGNGRRFGRTGHAKGLLITTAERPRKHRYYLRLRPYGHVSSLRTVPAPSAPPATAGPPG